MVAQRRDGARAVGVAVGDHPRVDYELVSPRRPATQLRAGPATIIVALGDRTIRSRAAIVVVEAHVVRVAFDSGDIIALSPRSALGVIDPPARAGTANCRTCNVERLGPRTPDLRNHDGRE